MDGRRALWALAGALVLVAAVLFGAAPASAGEPAVVAPIVVVGVGGLAWEDVSALGTPRLWGLLDGGASAAAVSVRQGPGMSCPADGWLSLSAGQRSVGPRDGGCGALPRVSPQGRVARWPELLALQDGSDFDPELGSLAEVLAAHDVCATAVGPGAALALADSNGHVARYHPTLQPESFTCPITLVDAGTVAAHDLATVDRQVGELLDRAPEGATVLVVGLSEVPGGQRELGVALLTGSGEARLMRTATTRWDGVIRLLDVSSTLTAAVDVPDPSGFYGAPVTLADARPADPGATVRELHEITSTDQVLRRWSRTFNLRPSGVQLVIYAGAVVWAFAALPTSRWAGRTFTAVALGFAALPMAAYLVTVTRWWQAGSPGRALWGGMAAIAAVTAVVAARTPRRRLWWVAGAISLVTFVVITIDGATGTLLHRGSLLGPSPTLGGRFYGFGNPTFSVYIVAAFVLAGAAAAELLARSRRRAAVAAVAGIGALAMVVDVWPTWGGDVGGGLAMVPGFVLLALVVAELRVTVPRLAAAAIAGVAIVGAIGFADWLRPERDRSHAGRFVQEILDGEAGQMVSRKAGYAWDSLDAGPPAWITLVVLTLSAAALVRPERFAPPPLRAAFDQWPSLHATLGAVLITVVIGAVVNDYGVRIGTIALPAVLPLVAVTCARASEGQGVVGEERREVGPPAQAVTPVDVDGLTRDPA